MRKHLTAIAAAFFITAILALTIATVGVNALSNKNGTPVSNSAASSASNKASMISTSDTQIADLQAQLAVYKAREQQYQAALAQDNQLLAQASTQMQTVQQLLAFLQSRGIIQINSQGQIYVTGR